MKKTFFVCVCSCLALVSVSPAQSAAAQAKSASTTDAEPALPYSPSFDVSSMDKSVLTLGEDVADLGGEILAYLAWKDATKGKELKPEDDLNPDKRFFIGFAQWACDNERPENMRVRALTDPHSPARHRTNGVVVNMPEFARAFGCKQGQPMVKPPENVCRVW